MRSGPVRALRRILATIGILAAFLLLLLTAAYLTLRGSLPPLDGKLVEAGLAAPVTLERDALGVVTVTAANRIDLAFGTGFAHGQDRFFQMDLARRLAAGELSELVGPAALDQDERARVFRFRDVARRALAQATPEQRALLEAYTRGVNAGLASLRSRTWEYWLLRARPAPWRAEDSFLVVFAMWWQLQSGDLARERLRREIDARLGGPVCAGGWKCALAFLYPARTAWDAPNVADEAALRAQDARDAVAPAPPGPDVLDIRGGASAAVGARGRAGEPATSQRVSSSAEIAAAAEFAAAAELADIGSNGWAVAGKLTATGAALVASDMHLPLGVPPTWYRMRLRVRRGGVQGDGGTPGAARAPAIAAPSVALDLNGLTLPGAPALVVGSNGHVAWAFTNSDGKWLDVRPMTCLAVDDRTMRTPQGDVPVTTATERIHVRDAPDVLLPVRSAAGGLLLDADPTSHRCWIASWLADSPAATNMNLLAFERATSVQQVLALAPRIGIPAQNLVVGDSAGHIGWAIAGRVPVRTTAHDSPHERAALPGAAAPEVGTGIGQSAGTSQAAPPAWLSGNVAPHLYDPPIGRIWTANARSIDDPAALAAIGGDEASLGAQYDLGARAHQIRDALLRLDSPATPGDMLRIQLDDRALFLARWRELMLRLLDEGAVAGRPTRARMRQLVESWDARADVDSVGYRLVRSWHDRTEGAVWGMILHSLGIDGGEPRGRDAAGRMLPSNAAVPPPQQFERPLWTLVTQRPTYLLDAQFPDWRAFLLAQLDATAADLIAQCGTLARCRWGAAHPVHIRHPLSRALPVLSRLIDLPQLELPGDHDMPRVQDGAFGASERFAVSPGHEDRGYLQLPGGQCDHPLSPYFRAGFRAWAEGRPLPFLPGPAQHRLALQPPRGALH